MEEKRTPEEIAKWVVEDMREFWYVKDVGEWEVNFDRLETLIREGIERGLRNQSPQAGA